jgi:hypothetical protein
MAQSIVEVNDVDISPLFSWSREFEVVWGDTKVPVFMRLLGDADMNRARVAALRKSAELRRKLKDNDSDERMAFIKDIDDIDIDTLIAVVIVFSMREISERNVPKLKIRAPKIPRSDAKTSVHEKYQADIDSYPDRRQEELKALINKDIESMKASLLLEPKDTVYRKYVNAMIDEMCEQELLREFKSQCCYLGSYKDESLSERLFASYEDFNNLESSLKQQFLTEYSNIELHGDDLKKLQQVTQ